MTVIYGRSLSGVYRGVGNYVSAASVLGSSLVLGLINVHKQQRARRRRREARRQHLPDTEAALGPGAGLAGAGAGRGAGLSPVRAGAGPVLRSAVSYEVRM